MDELAKLALIGAVVSVIGTVAAWRSWVHRGEWQDDAAYAGYSNMMLGLFGLAGIIVGVCFMFPFIYDALGGA